MGSKSTWVGVFYVACAAVATVVFAKIAGLIFLQMQIADSSILGDQFTLSTLVGLVVAAALTGFAAMNPKARTFVNESYDELMKVSWPEWSETKTNTVVVIVFSFISAGILGVFDYVFSTLTNNNFFLY